MTSESARLGASGASGLPEAARLSWREDPSPATLRRDGRRWTAWTAWVSAVFAVPGALLIALEPLTAPAAAICFAHAWSIPWVQARRGARQLVALGGSRSAVHRPGADDGAERAALGLLADLVDHQQRGLAAATGLVVEPGALGVWLIGESGAMLVRRGGRRVDCWCVRVAETDGLPGADRVAHLLLALREDELGFVKVANLGFSGAFWRVRGQLPRRARPGLDRARALARVRTAPATVAAA